MIRQLDSTVCYLNTINKAIKTEFNFTAQQHKMSSTFFNITINSEI